MECKESSLLNSAFGHLVDRDSPTADDEFNSHFLSLWRTAIPSRRKWKKNKEMAPWRCRHIINFVDRDPLLPFSAASIVFVGLGKRRRNNDGDKEHSIASLERAGKQANVCRRTTWTRNKDEDTCVVLLLLRCIIIIQRRGGATGEDTEEQKKSSRQSEIHTRVVPGCCRHY